MYTKKILRVYSIFSKMCNLFRCSSLEWDPEAGALVPTKSPAKRRQFKLHMAIAFVHNIFLIVMFGVKDIPGFGVAYHMLAIYFTIGYVMCNGCKFVVWGMENEIITLVNAQLQFERQLGAWKSVNKWQFRGKRASGARSPGETMATTFQPGVPSNGEKFERNLLGLGIITGWSVPTLVFLILMAHPCLPTFIGSVVFEYKDNKCGGQYFNFYSYLGLGLLNFWMHLDMVLGFVFTMFGLFFMSIALLQDYIHVIKHNFPLIRNQSGLNGQPSVHKAPLQLYRCLQILENQVNTCFKSHYFPLFLGGMTALLIFCLHACIKLPGKIPMPGFSYFPMVAFDGIIALLVMNTKAATMSLQSARLIREWRYNPRLQRKHWVKKMAISLVPLKIKLGSNFVDQLTPLLIVNFTVNQVVSLLLIQS